MGRGVDKGAVNGAWLYDMEGQSEWTAEAAWTAEVAWMTEVA